MLNKSVLLLDEDPEILTFLTALFEQRGLRVLRARSRDEMLELLKRDYVPVDLILANIVITHLSDSDFEQDVASIRAFVPVLYMSAFVEDDVIRIEMMKRPYLVTNSMTVSSSAGVDAATEQEGVVNAVMSALTRPRTRASAN